MISLAIIGSYQIGKSSLVNALLRRNDARMGVGKATTHANRRYPMTPFLEILDTPGLGADGSDDKEASAAINNADVLVYVQESKALDDNQLKFLHEACSKRKPMLFVLNYKNQERWSPDDDKDDVPDTIEAQLRSTEVRDCFIPSEGRFVYRLNVLWARYALGLTDGKESKRICRYMEDENLEMDKDAIMKRSGFLCFRDMILNLPFVLLKDTATQPQREFEQFVAIFRETFALNRSKFF